jgi:hypothetical protein
MKSTKLLQIIEKQEAERLGLAEKHSHKLLCFLKHLAQKMEVIKIGRAVLDEEEADVKTQQAIIAAAQEHEDVLQS